MFIEFSENAKAEFSKIKHKDAKLHKKIEKQLTLLAKNSRHPSLRIHKLAGKLNQSMSLSVKMSIRIVYVLVDDGIYIVGIGTHDQVYRN